VALVSSDVPHNCILIRGTNIIGEGGIVATRPSADDALWPLHLILRILLAIRSTAQEIGHTEAWEKESVLKLTNAVFHGSRPLVTPSLILSKSS